MIIIEEQLLQNAKLFPNKTALIAGETAVTYGELWDRCLKTADVLRSRLSLKKGDRVSGQVKFMILGPVNTVWDEITRRHPTFFRHTRWAVRMARSS